VRVRPKCLSRLGKGRGSAFGLVDPSPLSESGMVAAYPLTQPALPCYRLGADTIAPLPLRRPPGPALTGGRITGRGAKATGHHRSQCLTMAKAPHRAAAPITAARSIAVISRQLIIGLPTVKQAGALPNSQPPAPVGRRPRPVMAHRAPFWNG
jgi:hypothetical protein